MNDERDNPLRIVVLDGRRDRYASEVTATIAAALARGEDEGTVPTESALGGGEDRLIHAADAAVVLDPASLERAREAGTRLCVAVLPGFDASWPGDLSEADQVIVAHPSLVPEAVRRGAPQELVSVAGPIAPEGYRPVENRAALRREAGLEPEAPVVLVPGAALEQVGPEALLVQLALVGGDARFLFDVGTDPEVAELLRRTAPAHGLRAWMFADEEGSAERWQLADVVVGRPRGYEVARALAVGLPLVLLPAGRSQARSADALDASGVARAADVLATLSVAIDLALGDEALAEAREAVAALDVPGSAARLAGLVRDTWERHDAAGAGLPRGLPHGLEQLPAEPVAERKSGRPSRAPVQDIEARIDRELAELKKRL